MRKFKVETNESMISLRTDKGQLFDFWDIKGIENLPKEALIFLAQKGLNGYIKGQMDGKWKWTIGEYDKLRQELMKELQEGIVRFG